MLTYDQLNRFYRIASRERERERKREEIDDDDDHDDDDHDDNDHDCDDDIQYHQSLNIQYITVKCTVLYLFHCNY